MAPLSFLHTNSRRQSVNTFPSCFPTNYNQRSYPVNEGFFFRRAISNKNAKRNMVIHWFEADESGGVSWAFEPMGIRRLTKNTFWIIVGGEETTPPSRETSYILTSTYLRLNTTGNSQRMYLRRVERTCNKLSEKQLGEKSFKSKFFDKFYRSDGKELWK